MNHKQQIRTTCNLSQVSYSNTAITRLPEVTQVTFYNFPLFVKVSGSSVVIGIEALDFHRALEGLRVGTPWELFSMLLFQGASETTVS